MACWKKQHVYGCWVLGIVFVFVKQIPVFTKIGLYPGCKRKSKACENLFVMSIRVSHLCCNSSVSLCCSLWGKQEGLRWGGLSFLFPSVAYRFLLCIKLPLKSVKILHLEKRY